MVALSEVPLNSLTWSAGTLACFALGYRSLVSYRRSANELTKYIAWFGLIMGVAQALFALPPLFTLDPATLRTIYLIVELVVYMSSVAQAAIVWCLMLRAYVPIYYATMPIIIIGTAAWLYSLPRASVHLTHRFVNYHDPLFSTVIIGIMLLILFVPVGIYFLRSVARQAHLKAKLSSLALGLLYVGIGVSTGGLELLTGQVLAPVLAIPDAILFVILLIALLWPHHPATQARSIA